MALHCLPKYLSQFVSAYCSIFSLNKNRLEFSDLCYIIFQQKLARILRVMLYKSSCQKEARDVFIGCTMWSLDRCSNAMTYSTAVGLKIKGLKRLVRTKFWLLWERAHLLALPEALYAIRGAMKSNELGIRDVCPPKKRENVEILKNRGGGSTRIPLPCFTVFNMGEPPKKVLKCKKKTWFF